MLGGMLHPPPKGQGKNGLCGTTALHSLIVFFTEGNVKESRRRSRWRAPGGNRQREAMEEIITSKPTHLKATTFHQLT